MRKRQAKKNSKKLLSLLLKLTLKNMCRALDVDYKAMKRRVL